MAVIYLRLSKRHNELNRNEIIMTFRQGSTIYQRAGTGIFILDKPNYWDGEKMVLRARSMTEEVKYHREMKHKLEDLCSVVNRAWEETDRSRISPTWLKDVIAQFNTPAVEDDELMGEPDRETVTSTLWQAVACPCIVRNTSGRCGACCAGMSCCREPFLTSRPSRTKTWKASGLSLSTNMSIGFVIRKPKR